MKGLPVCDQRAAVYHGRRPVAKLPGRRSEIIRGTAAELAEHFRLAEVDWRGFDTPIDGRNSTAGIPQGDRTCERAVDVGACKPEHLGELFAVLRGENNHVGDESHVADVERAVVRAAILADQS